jgi:phospholipid/cholesterol/gamma-HCH transport system permease protein
MASPGFTLSEASRGGDVLRLELSGSVTLADGPALWARLHEVVRGAETIEIDVARIDRLDGGAAALLHAAASRSAPGGGPVRFVGAAGDTKRLLDLYAIRPEESCDKPPPALPGLLTDVGEFAHTSLDSTRALLAFVGDLALGVVRAFHRPRSVHIADLGRLVEHAGTDGIPIIVLINFLVGGVMGLQGAIQLHRFGGDTFLASLVGLSMVREFGPLMTAILVTGRSGAGYAAELGTMVVNEEVDALRTLGQDPQRFLVFPRVCALLLVVPVLTLLADFAGVLGGFVIAVTYLEQPSVVYLQMLERSVDLVDVGTGLLKSCAFAAAIGLIACQRGLGTRGGASGVGNSTTSAVVVGMFALVVIDAVFTNLFSLLGW